MAGHPDDQTQATREKNAHDVLKEHGFADIRHLDSNALDVWERLHACQVEMMPLADRDGSRELGKPVLPHDELGARKYHEQEEGVDTVAPGDVEDRLREEFVKPLRDRELMESLRLPGNEDNWAHRSAAMRCRTCMFYVPKGDGRIGRCRHDAPTLKGWPAIYPTDWCGAHKLDEEKL